MAPKTATTVCVSEAIEPAMAHIVGRLWKRCEEAKKSERPFELEDELHNLWYAMEAMLSLSVATKGATHFSVALGNHYQEIANYIESVIGYNPILQRPEDHPQAIYFDFKRSRG